MAARPVFDEELKELRLDLSRMGELVKDAIDGSLEAVTQHDIAKAMVVARNDVAINDMERDIEQLCLRLLLCETPVATDLRLVTAALKMITDLERIGDQAGEICEIATTLPKGADLGRFPALSAMAAKAKDQVDAVIDSFTTRDLTKVRECIDGDEVINFLFEEVKDEIVAHIVEHQGDESYVFDVMMIAKYLERVGDHVVNIAEWVEYAITGIHKGNTIHVQ